jgi:hypothetical protein
LGFREVVSKTPSLSAKSILALFLSKLIEIIETRILSAIASRLRGLLSSSAFSRAEIAQVTFPRDILIEGFWRAIPPAWQCGDRPFFIRSIRNIPHAFCGFWPTRQASRASTPSVALTGNRKLV